MEPVINLITPPDKLYNGNLSFLLVSPSDDKKEQFNQMAKRIGQDLNVYLFDKNETDVPWLLDVGQEVDQSINGLLDTFYPLTKLFT